MKIFALTTASALLSASFSDAAAVSSMELGAINVLQVTGAVPTTGGIGGTATAERRTVYFFASDKSSTPSDTTCATPTYGGGGWPLVYVDSVELGNGINAGQCLASTLSGSTNQILCCKVTGYGLMPMYQYYDDSAAGDTKGLGTGFWWTIDGQGKSSEPGDSSATTPSGSSSSGKAAVMLASILSVATFLLF